MTSIRTRPRVVAIVGLAAMTLAISAIAAPAASARVFDPDPHPGVYVSAFTGYATPVPTAQTQITATRPDVHANPDQQATQTGPVSPSTLQQAWGSQFAAIDRAKEQALANHVPPTGRFGKADLNAYATTVHPNRYPPIQEPGVASRPASFSPITASCAAYPT